MRELACEIKRGSRIHDRKYDFARFDELPDRSDVGEAGLARQSFAARTALVERSADVETFLLQLQGDCLSHVAGTHDADIFDFHPFASGWRVANDLRQLDFTPSGAGYEYASCIVYNRSDSRFGL